MKQKVNHSLVLDVFKSHPHWNGADIGRALNISRERVRQILRVYGYRIPNPGGTVDYTCTNCGKPSTRDRSQANMHRLFCSFQCYGEWERGKKRSELWINVNVNDRRKINASRS